MRITFNGTTYDVDEGFRNVPLLWTLRESFRWTDTKFGCGSGLCGACTVHVDGIARRSCLLPTGETENKKVTTLKGLVAENHFLLAAWEKHQVPQCGYCQPGQIMAAAALLAKKPNPTSDEVDSAMSGNLCRCGTYPRIKKAIMDQER